MPSRGVVIPPLAFRERGSEPYGDRAYVTTRFPFGINRADLLQKETVVVRETMLFWFLRNYEPGGEPGPESVMGRVPYSSVDSSTDPPTVRGFNRPYAFTGTIDQLVSQEFAIPQQEEVLAELVSSFPGLWTLKPELDLPASDTQDELRASLLSLLDEFDQDVRDLPSAGPSRWHNSPPERLDEGPAALTSAERNTTLRATASLRMAVGSNDFAWAGEVWKTISFALGKIGAYVLSLADTYAKELTKKAAGWTIPAAIVAYEMHHGLLDKGEAIRATLKLLGVDLP